MSDDEYDNHGTYLSNKVYITIPGVSTESVAPFLRRPEHEREEGDEDSFFTETRLGEGTQALIKHHRATTPVDNTDDIHPRLFMVVDSPDLQGRGVLLVSLKEYHGYNDALRFSIESARNIHSSLILAIENWSTCRYSSEMVNTPAMATKWFALYNLLPEGREDDFKKALEAMNEGLQMVGLDEEDEDDEEGAEDVTDKAQEDDMPDEKIPEENIGDEQDDDDADQGDVEDEDLPDAEEEPEEGYDEIYKAVSPELQVLQNIKDEHATRAKEDGMDPVFFAVIDEDYETQGPLLVRVDGEGDSFRCKGPVGGELMRWIFVKLMTWDEAKSFAQERDKVRKSRHKENGLSLFQWEDSYGPL
ncbi:hypothetical protein F5X68DRAFT_259610 [Plectosphaerella plurivora]|uniref:Uncharacterized protein n=1 Tax=Plectosphaerella plurivora TaxID=936078 RepID=A0A9P8VH65_9PEZI|nr:hypothetical protein F5X68DRAFT_259610 [Plectosphaerella plurivora]